VADELVTGEAVALDIRVARLGSRGLAFLIDAVVQVMALYIGAIMVGLTAEAMDSDVAVGLFTLLFIFVLVGYPAATETLSRGRTLGKVIVGLRVVGDDGSPERFRQALVRSLAGLLEMWMLVGSPALFASLLNGRGKRLGDTLAGTIVIQDRVPVTGYLGPVAIMPQQLAGWASTLELSLLPDRLAMSARQYLARFWELVPGVRDVLGQQLIDEVLTYVTPPPPKGFRPEIYLSAVLAERRRRDERRLAERAVRRAAVAGRRFFPAARF
jgi:uncharacterized RDD family membrane protein YckC